MGLHLNDKPLFLSKALRLWIKQDVPCCFPSLPLPQAQDNSEMNSSLISPCHIQALQARGSYGVIPDNSSRALSTHTSSREILLLTQSGNLILDCSYRAFFYSWHHARKPENWNSAEVSCSLI